MTRPATDVAVIALRGDHDAVTKEHLAGVLATEVSNNALVVLDLTDASFIDSSVLHNLIEADRLAVSRGVRFVIQVAPTHLARGVFDINRVLRTLTRVETLEEVLRPRGADDRTDPGIAIGEAA